MRVACGLRAGGAVADRREGGEHATVLVRDDPRPVVRGERLRHEAVGVAGGAGRLGLVRDPPALRRVGRVARASERIEQPQLRHQRLRRHRVERSGQIVALVAQHVTLQAVDERVAQVRGVADGLLHQQLALGPQHQPEQHRPSDRRGQRDDDAHLHAQPAPPPHARARHVEKPCRLASAGPERACRASQNLLGFRRWHDGKSAGSPPVRRDPGGPDPKEPPHL